MLRTAQEKLKMGSDPTSPFVIFRRFIVAVSCCVALGAAAAPADLDMTFGTNGVVLTNFSEKSGSARAESTAQQPDGKIVAAGYAYNGTSTDFALARFNADGSLDSSFGAGGTVVTPMGGRDDYGQAVAIQNDGKIIVAGYTAEDYVSGGQRPRFALARYLPNGTLDSTFGVGGKVLTTVGEPDEFGPMDAYAYALAVQSDGKILVAGYRNRPPPITGSEFVVVRYLTDGSLDSSFGASGKAVADFGGFGVLAHGFAIAFDGDGKIIVGGRANSVSGLSPAVVRFNNNGTLDSTFGSEGRVTIDFGMQTEVRSVLIQPDSNLVLVGPHAVARITSSGALDATFGNDGMVMIPGGLAAILETDGKITVAGRADSVVQPGNVTVSDFMLYRMLPNGSLDPSFGTNGTVVTAVEPGLDWASGLLRTSDGKYVAVGFSTPAPVLLWSASVNRFTLAKYDASGQPDTVFGSGNATAFATLGNSDDQAYDALSILADGRILTAGETFNVVNNSYDLGIARFLPSGAPDLTFGTDGRLTVSLSPYNEGARALAVQSDGRFLVAGYSYGSGFGDSDFLVTRHLPDGSLDPTFGSGGVVLIDFAEGEDAAVTLALRPDGKIVVGGTAWVSPGYRFAVVQLLPNGAIDTDFGASGFYFGTSGYANKLVLQSDGRVLVAGNIPYDASIQDYTRIGIVRLNADGSIDSTFGTNGVVDEGASSQITGANTVSLQTDGKIIIAGRHRGIYDYCMVRRYLPNGAPDSTFGTGGVTIISDNCTFANALALQGDGKLVGAGSFQTSPAYFFDIPVFRLNTDGSLDSTFGSNGMKLFALGSMSDAAFSLRVLSGGKILISGISNNGGSRDFLLMQLMGEDTSDPIAPSVPIGLMASAVNSSQINLSWDASTDNVGVTAYQVYRDGVLHTTVFAPALSFSDTGLTASTSYSYAVAACDTAGNCSAPSGAASATTLAVGQYYFEPVLPAGFTLLGNALELTLDVAALFGNQDPGMQVAGVTAYVESVWKWNSVQDRWAFYSPLLTSAGIAAYAASRGYEVLATIDPGEGYWVKATQPITLPAQSGTAYPWNGFSFSALPSGFNLISDAGGVAPDEFNLQVTEPPPAQGVVPTTNFRSLWAWDAVQMKWYFYAPILEASGGLDAVKAYTDSHNLLHFQDYGKLLGLGTGFWVNRP